MAFPYKYSLSDSNMLTQNLTQHFNHKGYLPMSNYMKRFLSSYIFTTITCGWSTGD